MAGNVSFSYLRVIRIIDRDRTVQDFANRIASSLRAFYFCDRVAPMTNGGVVQEGKWQHPAILDDKDSRQVASGDLERWYGAR